MTSASLMIDSEIRTPPSVLFNRLNTQRLYSYLIEVQNSRVKTRHVHLFIDVNALTLQFTGNTTTQQTSNP